MMTMTMMKVKISKTIHKQTRSGVRTVDIHQK